MKKNIIKKIFIRISKMLGFELIDQNEFVSPTLNKELNQNLSNKDKSIVLPLGEVNLSRKTKSLLILLEQTLILKFGIKIKKEFLSTLK